MKGWVFYVISILVLILAAIHLPRSEFLLVLITILFIYFCSRSVGLRKKVAADVAGQANKLQKISNTVIIGSGFGAFIASAFILSHQAYVGRILMTASCFLALAGFIILIISQLRANNTSLSPELVNQQRVSTVIFCLCVAGILIGAILRLNHYESGKLIMQGALAAFGVFLVVIVIYAKIIKRKSGL